MKTSKADDYDSFGEENNSPRIPFWCPRDPLPSLVWYTITSEEEVDSWWKEQTKDSDPKTHHTASYTCTSNSKT